MIISNNFDIFVNATFNKPKRLLDAIGYCYFNLSEELYSKLKRYLEILGWVHNELKYFEGNFIMLSNPIVLITVYSNWVTWFNPAVEFQKWLLSDWWRDTTNSRDALASKNEIPSNVQFCFVNDWMSLNILMISYIHWDWKFLTYSERLRLWT